MTTLKRLANERGRRAEAHAARFLAKAGLELLERNFRCPQGEIDLIMLDRNTLVFVEVKFRASRNYGLGSEFVDRRKQRKLRNSALNYLNRNARYRSLPCRFDVISIAPAQDDSAADELEVDWLPNALEMDW